MGGPNVPAITNVPSGPPTQLDPALIEARRRMAERSRGASGISSTSLSGDRSSATAMLPALMGSGRLSTGTNPATPLGRR